MSEQTDFSQGLRVNFSEKEAEVKDFDELPIGKYICLITDVEVRFSKQKQNGQPIPDTEDLTKPYFAFEFTVDEGTYAGRKMWTNAMLFEGALYTISGMCQALGIDVAAGDVQIPGTDFWPGKRIGVSVRKGKAQVGNGTPDAPQYPARNEARGFFAATSGAVTSSLLP